MRRRWHVAGACLVAIFALTMPAFHVSAQVVSGRSYGGIVRSGPSQESRRIGSLTEGQRLTIVRNSGVVWADYAWFQIRANGLVGYMWGGILCADSATPGVLAVCGRQSQATPQPPAIVPVPANKPPIWCRSARLPAEQAICADPQLSSLDEALQTVYERALFDSKPKRAEISREHRRWLGRRNACGSDGVCIRKRYDEQIQILETYLAN